MTAALRPLWKRALDARGREKVAKRQSRRTHPEVRVGDPFGVWTVTAILGRGHRGRSDLRVRARCVCGQEAETYEFNLRSRAPRCGHVRKAHRPDYAGAR